MLCAAMLAMCLPTWGAEAPVSRPVVLKLGHGLDISHPVHKAMVFLADRVKEKSAGRMQVQIFPSEQLGNEKECIEALQLGYLAMTKTSSAPMEGFVPQMQVFGIPYLFRDSEHLWKVLNGPIGKKLLLAGESKRLRGLCYYDAGARSFYAKKPIHTPSDLAGMKIRVQQSDLWVALLEAMGANATPMPYGEVYTALQQKTVDGEENPVAIVYDAKFYEVQKFYSLTGHVYSATMLVTNKKFLDKLPADLRKIVTDAARRYVVEQRKLSDKQEGEFLGLLKKAGMKVNDVTPAEKTAFVKATLPVYDSFKDVLGADLIETAKKVAGD